LNGVSFGKDLKVRGNVHVMRHYENTSITIGNHVIINSAGWANPIGCGSKTYFQVFDNGKIKIGDYCGISNTAFTSAAGITVGNNVLIGAGCHLFDTDFHPLNSQERMFGKTKSYIKSKPIIIEDGAFIGAGSYILKGVHIGKNSIIGAGSVVTKDVPDYEIWAGNPAVYIRNVD
jgi:acetyltransferase-like isoleucine patch superfamily enzyme